MALRLDDAMNDTVPLSSLCRVFRSKNASPFLTTIDLFFDSKEKFILVKDSEALKPVSLARRLGVDESSIIGLHSQEEALGIKITMLKRGGYASGDPESADVFGAQQYIPLLDLPVIVSAS
jgi:hypothetical protein